MSDVAAISSNDEVVAFFASLSMAEIATMAAELESAIAQPAGGMDAVREIAADWATTARLRRHPDFARQVRLNLAAERSGEIYRDDADTPGAQPGDG